MRTQLLKHFWIVTVLFLGTAAFLSARLTAALLAGQLWVPGADRPPTVAQGRDARPGDRLPGYRIIEERNLFNANPAPPPAAEEAPIEAATTPPPPPPPPPPLNLTLLGTALVDGGVSFALLQMGNEIRVVRQGAEVAPGAALTAVKADRIVVTRGGVPQEFLLFRPEPAPAQARAQAPRPPPPPAPEAPAETPAGGDTVRQVAPGRWLVDAREIQEASANMSRLMTQIRVVPNFTDGQPDGFKVFAIRPGSLFARIGLQNGDVVKRLNGLEMQGPEQAFEAYQRLKDETAIQIDLVRRNENLSFGYEIR